MVQFSVVFVVPVCFVLIPRELKYALKTLLVDSEQLPSWWKRSWSRVHGQSSNMPHCNVDTRSSNIQVPAHAQCVPGPGTCPELSLLKRYYAGVDSWARTDKNQSLDLSSLQYTIRQHKRVHKASSGSAALQFAVWFSKGMDRQLP